MTIVVHLDDMFAVGEKERCDQFGTELNPIVPVKNLGDLRCYSGCLYERDGEKGVLNFSQQTLAEQLVDEYGIEFGKSVPLFVGLRDLRNLTRTKHQGTGHFVSWYAH